jgi:AcrR family transcriptional regulator
MSDQNPNTPRRAYRKRLRAEQEEETRRRITEATVDLHGSVGPAQTTVSAIAERAGVQRATVYRHFPDEPSLFQACSAHWLAANAPPDPTAWAEIADPDQRLRTALAELYDWYGRTAYMTEKVVRDAALVPAMAAQMEARTMYLDAAGEVLVRGRPERGARRRRAAAAIGHALAFETWRSLVEEQGLTGAEGVELMAALVETAGSAAGAALGSARPG